MKDRTKTLTRAPHPDDNVNEVAATVLERFPAGAPRGSWPAEEFAAARRTAGQAVDVVMNLDTDTFDVVKAGV